MIEFNIETETMCAPVEPYHRRHRLIVKYREHWKDEWIYLVHYECGDCGNDFYDMQDMALRWRAVSEEARMWGL